MNYIKISNCDIANGPGVRAVLWTVGCTHACPECHNPDTWNPEAGKLFDEKSKKQLFDILSQKWIEGITFSGGDPLHENNINDILSLIKEIKAKFPQKDIWLYTGYTWEEINENNDVNSEIRKSIIKLCDVIVDGPFILNLKDITLKWCGSSNQRVIDIKNTLSNNKVIIYEGVKSQLPTT